MFRSLYHRGLFIVMLSLYEDLALGKNEIILLKNTLVSIKEKYLKYCLIP